MNQYYQKDLYAILGVAPESDEMTIKSAYRKQARIWHPDVNDNSQESIVRFKEITEAYEVLTDTQKRSQYDILKGFNVRTESKYTRTQAQKAYNENSSTKTKEKSSSAEMNNSVKPDESKKSFSSVFENIMDGLFTGGGNSKKNESVGHSEKKKKLKPEYGRDINLTVIIKMQEAISGTHRTVNVLHSEKCPKCEGRRFINGSKCPLCKGTGEISIHKKLNVKIPAGVKKGAKIRIAGEGNKGYNGGKNGDLYIFVEIEENSFFRYEGNNVLCEIPITPFEAVLGANIEVPTPCGNVSMKIPPYTSTGQKFCLSGQGITDKNKKKGDQIVIVKIVIPKEMSTKEIELYKQLQSLSDHKIRENLLNDK